MRDDRQRIMDMLDAIENIDRYVNAGSDFHPSPDDELLDVWVIHHLQIIGEAASKLSAEFRQAYPEVSWGGMIGMRQVLVHGYFETNSTIVWKVVQNDFPVLKRQLTIILEQLK
jgi:uncharacterized protein with HEPN domain